MGHTALLAAGALVGYLVLMFANPARASLRDGLRCLGRYGTLWRILTLFGLCYAVFQIGVEVFCHYNMPEGQRPIFQWSRPWFLPEQMRLPILKGSILPAFEGAAGLFNVLITTFPFSAIAAILFFTNWDGHHGVLFRALRRRFGWGWGWGTGWGLGWGPVIYFGILLCALAALVKPLLYSALLPMLSSHIPGLDLLQISFVVVWLSFLFEIMFGTCVQIYLILIVYAWVRGLNFTRQHMIDFAIRRFSFVMKWSLLIMLLSTLLIHLPLILTVIPPFSHMLQQLPVFYYCDHVARPIMAGFLLLFCGMQIILTFHSESLGKALRGHFHFLRKDAWSIIWFLLVALVHFYILNVLNSAITSGFSGGPDDALSADLGSETAITIVWRLFYPLLSAFVAGWMLAAWVCLYKRSEAGRIHAEDWIKY